MPHWGYCTVCSEKAVCRRCYMCWKHCACANTDNWDKKEDEKENDM